MLALGIASARLARSLAVFLLPVAFSAAAASASAAPTPGFDTRIVTLADSTRVFAKYHQGQPGKSTFVLVNGLIYGLERWDVLANRLAAHGYTVIRYAFSAQPESLRLLAPGESPRFLKSGIELTDLASELSQVINAFGATNKLHLVGLSYGAAVAAEYAVTHQERLEALILMSPLVVPLDNYTPAGSALRAWLNSVRFWENTPCDLYGSLNPWLCTARDLWYESLYTYLYQTYLFERVQDQPTGIDLSLYKKAVFHLVRAARDFDLRSYSSRLTNVHLFVATRDDASLLVDQARAWQEIAPDERRSYVSFDGAHHALPDEAPLRTAEQLEKIAEKLPETQKGQTSSVPADR